MPSDLGHHFFMVSTDFWGHVGQGGAGTESLSVTTVSLSVRSKDYIWGFSVTDILHDCMPV